MKKKNLTQRLIIIALVTLAGIYIVIGPRRKPTLQDFTWSGIKATLDSNINLGLDLKGGSHLVMRVKTDDFLKLLTENNAPAIENAAKEAGLAPKGVRAETAGSYRIILEATDASNLARIDEEVRKKVDLQEWATSNSGNTITWTLSPTAQRALAEQATEQAHKIILSRLEGVGVVEPLVQRHGSQSSHQILVQMPGISDPQRVKELLKADSNLELVHVVGQPNPAPTQTYATKEEAEAMLVAMKNIDFPRPMTFNLITEIIRTNDLKPEGAYITELSGGVFISVLKLKSERGVREYDARPSDSITIALMFNCPIFVSQKIIDSAGFPVPEKYKKMVPQEKGIENLTQLIENSLFEMKTKLESFKTRKSASDIQEQVDKLMDIVFIALFTKSLLSRKGSITTPSGKDF